MDGATCTIIQAGVTVITVGIGFWQVHERLRDRIDKVKDEATAAKEASIKIGAKVDGYITTCQAHREGFDKRLTRVEKISNNKKCD